MRILRISIVFSMFSVAACQFGGIKDTVPDKEPIPVTVSVKQPIFCSCGGVDTFVPRPTPPYVVQGRVKKNPGKDERKLIPVEELTTWTCMKPQGYENIAGNISDMTSRARQFSRVEQCYLDCIKDHNADAKND